MKKPWYHMGFEKQVKLVSNMLGADNPARYFVLDGFVLFATYISPGEWHLAIATPEIIGAICKAGVFSPDDRVESAYPMASAYFHEDWGTFADEAIEQIGYLKN